jgi:hypothetical protein
VADHLLRGSFSHSSRVNTSSPPCPSAADVLQWRAAAGGFRACGECSSRSRASRGRVRPRR